MTHAHLITAYHFNVILDAHSMTDAPDRPEISFGIEFIPKFYMPIVKSMQRSLAKKGYKEVKFNIPYKGGYILQSLKEKFPNAFTCAIEINKKVYMMKDQIHTDEHKVSKVKKDLYSLFNIP